MSDKGLQVQRILSKYCWRCSEIDHWVISYYEAQRMIESGNYDESKEHLGRHMGLCQTQVECLNEMGCSCEFQTVMVWPDEEIAPSCNTGVDYLYG